MVNEVALHKLRKRKPRSLRKLAKAYANARIGRLGMSLTNAQTEKAPGGRGQIHPENIAAR
jgi:hypothetical protein